MTDYKSIIPLALNGDAAALDELYKSTCRAVYFTCVCLLKNAEDAEDITQNTYITAFAKLKTLENPERFEPWIKRIAANLCKDFLIKKGAHPSEPLDEETFEEVDENFLPEEYAEASEKREIVLKIMRETLSDALYQTVIMFYFDELTIAEIAEEMGCPEGTVKYRLNAARAKIKTGVLDYEKKSGDKLYTLVGVPFLALLLSRQAEAAAVPALDIMSVITQNAPYAPVTAAVDPSFSNSAASTARRIGGKMFGTLKAKIIAGACAAAVVGGGVTAGVIIANNAKKNDPNRPAYSSTSKPNSGNSGSGNGIDYSQSRFWFARQTWDEPPRDWFEGGVLADKRDIHDVDLHKIDNISAPFKGYKVILDEAHDYTSGTFEDVYNSEWIIEPGKHVGIETQHHSSDEISPPYDGLGEITIFNFDSEPRTVGYCLEQRWWQNHQNGEYPPDETRTLGLDSELRETGPAPKEYEMLDAIREKFGTPHYICYGSIHEDDKGLDPKTQLFKEVEREFDTSYDGLVGAYYDMIYDYGDILMIITVREQIVGTNNINDVYYVEFWPRECWEHRTDIEPFYGGENGSEQMFCPYEGTQTAPPKPGNNSGSNQEQVPQQSDLPFRFAQQKWTEAPRKTFEGGLLIDNRKTIDPQFLDDICAPYYNGLLTTENQKADKFSQVLMAEGDIPEYMCTDVYTQSGPLDIQYNKYSGAQIIRIYNLDNIPHSMYDCYENGWWKITYDEDYYYLPVTASLGLPDTLIDEYDESALFDAIVEKFGTPHYIYYPHVYKGSYNPDRRAAIYEDMESVLSHENGMFYIEYQLVYELENDVVMSVCISERPNSDGQVTLEVVFVEFWSGACWENRNAVANLDFDTDDIELFKVYEP